MSVSVPIFNKSNYDCNFCTETKSKDGFNTCSNPLIYYDVKQSGSMVLSCPDGCLYKDNMNSSGNDIVVGIKNLIKSESVEGWLCIESKKVIELMDSNESIVEGYDAMTLFDILMESCDYFPTEDDNVECDGVLYCHKSIIKEQMEAIQVVIDV